MFHLLIQFQSDTCLERDTDFSRGEKHVNDAVVECFNELAESPNEFIETLHRQGVDHELLFREVRRADCD
jgi:hypothetical protein